MEKVFSNWLLDIAKYIVTALILSTAITDKLEGWLYYTACIVLVAGIVLFGARLFKLAERKEKKNNQQSNP